ncbi:spore germination protein GerPE [Paenibacillus naphthalenovorans]|uniref:spore germination protein GerPE n=1 Tax=Paenibacillus naphthalenovorans TaxID=162209 RepID=UPI003D2CC106
MALPVRTSVVNRVMIYNIGYASALNAGDLGDFSPVTLALAVHREIPAYHGKEGNLKAYPIFSAPLPVPRQAREVRMSTHQVSGAIHVNNVEVLAISTSSLVQIGSIISIRSESRIKHIRQLLRGLRPK